MTRGELIAALLDMPSSLKEDIWMCSTWETIFDGSWVKEIEIVPSGDGYGDRILLKG